MASANAHGFEPWQVLLIVLGTVVAAGLIGLLGVWVFLIRFFRGWSPRPPDEEAEAGLTPRVIDEIVLRDFTTANSPAGDWPSPPG